MRIEVSARRQRAHDRGAGILARIPAADRVPMHGLAGLSEFYRGFR